MATDSQSMLMAAWGRARQSIQLAFNKRFGTHPTQLPAGTELYKYSGQNPFDSTRNGWSPWWNVVRSIPIRRTDGSCFRPPTLDEKLWMAKRLGVSEVRLARVGSAVKDEWNEMNTLWIVRLAVPTWAMFGRNSGLVQSDNKPDQSNVFNIGGNYQFWTPELGRDDMQLVEKSAKFMDGKV